MPPPPHTHIGVTARRPPEWVCHSAAPQVVVRTLYSDLLLLLLRSLVCTRWSTIGLE